MRAKKGVLLSLLVFNLILLAAGWIMALYAYPKLPSRFPLWLPFFGQDPMASEKTAFFFVYVLVQTLLLLGYGLIAFLYRGKPWNQIPPRLQDSVRNLEREILLLALIFFQLIFIHIQRSLILMAHGVEKGIRPYYFYSIFGMILIFIPYYRMRLKAITRD